MLPFSELLRSCQNRNLHFVWPEVVGRNTNTWRCRARARPFTCGPRAHPAHSRGAPFGTHVGYPRPALRRCRAPALTWGTAPRHSRGGGYPRRPGQAHLRIPPCSHLGHAPWHPPCWPHHLSPRCRSRLAAAAGSLPTPQQREAVERATRGQRGPSPAPPASHRLR